MRDTTVTMRTRNARIDIDADPVFDVLSELLMCRLIWGAVEHDDFKSCVDQITELIAGKYLDAVSIGRAIAVNAAEINGTVICCQDAFVNVNDDTSVDVVFVLGEPEPQPDEPEPPRGPPRPPRDLGLDPKGNDLPDRFTPFSKPGYVKPAMLQRSSFLLP